VPAKNEPNSTPDRSGGISIEVMQKMKLKIMKSLGSLGLLAFGGGLLLSPVQPVNAAEPGGERGKLIGTWFTNVTLRDCGNNQELGSFPALGTFASGGTLTDTTTGFSPALRSPGHGSWEQTGRNKYSSISLAFLFSPAGVWTGTQRFVSFRQGCMTPVKVC